MSVKIEVAIRVAQAIEKSLIGDEYAAQRALAEAQEHGINMFDSLRAHILLKVAEGNPQVVSGWLFNSELYSNSQLESVGAWIGRLDLPAR